MILPSWLNLNIRKFKSTKYICVHPMRSKYLKTVSLLLMLHTPEKGPIKASRTSIRRF